MPATRFLKAYLIAAVALAIIGIADSVLLFLALELPFYSPAVSVFSFLFFFFNLLAFFVFYHQSLERIVYVLPVYYLVSFVVFGIAGVVLSAALLKSMFPYLVAISLLTSLFEFGFSVYLLRRFRGSAEKL